MYLEKIEKTKGISDNELRTLLAETLEGRHLRRVLLLPPDFTRLHSFGGAITRIYYHMLTERGCDVDIMPAVGTHGPVTREQAQMMFGDVPYERLLKHNWKEDTVKLGEVPGSVLEEYTEGMWREAIEVEVNRKVMEEAYDLVISVGQVVPHEVVGMANHSKNLFVGVGGSDMIHKSHMLGAMYGMERMMGKDFTPVRKMFDYAFTHFLENRPVLFVLTVCTQKEGGGMLNGLFAGEGRRALEEAVRLSQEINITCLDRKIRKCVTYLDPVEFRSTWVGNKAIYRTRMAVADGGELIILAPGVRVFGEDADADRLIRAYGYRGRERILEALGQKGNEELRSHMGVAAHLIHGSSDGRFTITYAVKELTEAEVEGVGFRWADYDEIIRVYSPETLKEGYNLLPNGEEIYFIQNPALGLWK